MPRKLRQIIAELRAAGFDLLPGRGKGDHAVWRHPLVPENQLTIDGQPGDDARHYQEKQAREAIAAAKAAEATQGKD
jgi:predicted RNA binding protein YcfA (HicA-like mRNA interferase family)